MQRHHATLSPMSCGAMSLLTPIGYQCGDCGYCKASDSSASYYVRSKSTCPSRYQLLMDRGWRRSGALFYLPDAVRSCCPHYTIRLPAAEFRPTRDQRQALNRWKRFVLGDQYSEEVSKKYPKSKAEKREVQNTFDLASAVHESEFAQCKPGISPDHRFEVTLEPDTFTEEKFALFENYQRHVHHEGEGDITRNGFKRFLCSSPLHTHSDTDGKHLGSFHHCYRLDGRLIAMSVLDLLPHAVSGVYFIYHSDMEKWSFGKLSALREAALALEAGYGYYYMGYYIHGCKKMRYKGDYRPQYVLDYYTFEWDVLDDKMRALMDSCKYASMPRERNRSANGGELVDDPRFVEITPDLLPHPLEATQASRSLLDLTMPGVMSAAELEDQIDLNAIKLFLGRGSIHVTEDIVSWEDGDILDTSSLRGIIAELCAAVGPDVASAIAVDLGR